MLPSEMQFFELVSNTGISHADAVQASHFAILPSLLSALLRYYTGYVRKICAVFSRRKRTDCRKLKQLNSFFLENNVDRSSAIAV